MNYLKILVALTFIVPIILIHVIIGPSSLLQLATLLMQYGYSNIISLIITLLVGGVVFLYSCEKYYKIDYIIDTIEIAVTSNAAKFLPCYQIFIHKPLISLQFIIITELVYIILKIVCIITGGIIYVTWVGFIYLFFELLMHGCFIILVRCINNMITIYSKMSDKSLSSDVSDCPLLKC